MAKYHIGAIDCSYWIINISLVRLHTRPKITLKLHYLEVEINLMAAMDEVYKQCGRVALLAIGMYS